jgi:hypothetical protein
MSIDSHSTRYSLDIDRILHSPWSLTTRGWIITGFLIALIFFPALFFPLPVDQAMFRLGGIKILQGATYYRDIVDVKPPLIYYINACAIFLFGERELSVRLFDLLLQALTCTIIVRLVRRVSFNDLWPMAAGILYAVVYVAQSPGGTAQAESYCGLLGFAMYWLSTYRPTRGGRILTGVLAGLLALLKYTFVALAGAIILIELTSEGIEPKKFFRDLFLMLCGISVVAATLVLYIVLHGSAGDYLAVQQFTQGYVHLYWHSVPAVLRLFTKSTPTYLADNYSVALSIGSIVAIGSSLARPSSGSPEARDAQKMATRLLQFAAMAFLALLISVAAEGRFVDYQFVRINPFGVVLAPYGFIRMASWFRDLPKRSRYLRFWKAVVMIVLLVFSPLTRYLYHAGGAYAALTGGPAAVDRYYESSNTNYSRSEIKEVAELIQSRRTPGDRLFVASAYGPLVYEYAATLPDFKIYNFIFVTAEYAPPEWRKSTEEYLLGTAPRFIVTQTNDSVPEMTGNSMTSDRLLHVLPAVDSLLDQRYSTAMRTAHFNVYELR